ncbi:hypothetical protein L6164_021773 [Bauhinia variegata]|uniref:Uncharacterized protein n=1 Tax=Bauhinia variegata TaxID=167791 RepID=A0ACB9MCM0_BAUVA|nr:hypothetical protein L6164_021773 [Bauhinia variegata]
MDFHSLSRKDLQALCKKNKIPANMTNVAMADALGALQQVEGLGKFLNPVGYDNTALFPDAEVVGTPQIHRTASRNSARRKSVREEPESSKVSTRVRRGTRAGNAEGNDQENKHLNVPATPAMPTSRTRAPAISTRRKKETHVQEDEKIDAPKTPAAPPSTGMRGAGRSVSSKVESTGGTAVQRTRRSVRLLEKSLADMRLMDTDETGRVMLDEISEEMINVSHLTKDSAKIEMESKNTDDADTSKEKNIGYKCKSQDSQSKVQLGSEAGTSMQAPFQEVNCNYYSEESEQHDSNPKLELCLDTYHDPSEVLECCDESKVEFSNQLEKEVILNDDSVDKGSGVLFELEYSIDFSNPENKFCSDAKQGVSDDASSGVIEQDIVGSLAVSSTNTDPMSPDELVKINTDNQDEKNEIENSIDFSNPKNKFSSDAKQDVPVGASGVASFDVTGQDIAGSLAGLSTNTDPVSPEEFTDNHDENNEIENFIDFSNPENKDVPNGASNDASSGVTEQFIAGFLSVSSINTDPESPVELVEVNTDNQGEKNEHWIVVDGNEMPHTDGSPAKLEVRNNPVLISCEKLEVKREPETSDSFTDLEESKGGLEKLVDVSENSAAHLKPGDMEFKMNHLRLNSENLEVREEHETSDLLCDLEESKEVEEKMVQVSENSVADLRPDIEVKMDSLKVESDNLEAKSIIVEESEALVRSDVIPEDIALTKLELLHSTDENEGKIIKHCISSSGGDEVTPSTLTLDSICEQKTSDIPNQSVSANQPKGSFPCVA